MLFKRSELAPCTLELGGQWVSEAMPRLMPLLQAIYSEVFSSRSARCQEKQQENISLGTVFVPSSVSVRMKLSSALDMPQPVPRLRLIPCTTRDDS